MMELFYSNCPRMLIDIRAVQELLSRTEDCIGMLLNEEEVYPRLFAALLDETAYKDNITRTLTELVYDSLVDDDNAALLDSEQITLIKAILGDACRILYQELKDNNCYENHRLKYFYKGRSNNYTLVLFEKDLDERYRGTIIW